MLRSFHRRDGDARRGKSVKADDLGYVVTEAQNVDDSRAFVDVSSTVSIRFGVDAHGIETSASLQLQQEDVLSYIMFAITRCRAGFVGIASCDFPDGAGDGGESIVAPTVSVRELDAMAAFGGVA